MAGCWAAEREALIDHRQLWNAARAPEVDLRELEHVRETNGLQAAMTSMMAVASTLHDGRDIPRLFTDGPVPPILLSDHLERERAEAQFIRV